jgi:hypothetical protein
MTFCLSEPVFRPVASLNASGSHPLHNFSRLKDGDSRRREKLRTASMQMFHGPVGKRDPIRSAISRQAADE